MNTLEQKSSALHYFKKWRDIISYRKYDEWCELHNEELLEQEFAAQNKLDPIYWCWNCKYHECDIH